MYKALDLEMSTELQKNAPKQNEEVNIFQYLNIMLSKYNEWTIYKTTMRLPNDYKRIQIWAASQMVMK